MRFVFCVCAAAMVCSSVAVASISKNDPRQEKKGQKPIFPRTKIVALDPGLNCIDGPEVPLVIEVPFDFRIPEHLIWDIPKK